MPYPPRRLNVLRVEDSPTSFLPEDICVKDLGRIGRWAEFVLALAENSLKATTRTGDEEIIGHPDFITIDHRFEKDSSVSFSKESPGVGWSHKLKQPNTGILIGTTLHARYANHDIPTVAVPHSGVPADFVDDLSTVLLLAQLQAHTIDWDPGRMVAQACDAAQRLPRLAQDAIRGSDDKRIRSGIESYRFLLLCRLGVPQREAGKPHDFGPRLLIDSFELTQLLTALDDAKDEEDLNARLDRIGLAVWTRDGREDCLDLRSLFLDHAKYDAATSRHTLPLDCAKQADGAVRSYLQRIYVAAACDFTTAAEFVLTNLDPKQASHTFDAKPPHAWKLLALVFATAEAWRAKAISNELEADRLESHWDPWDDEPSADKGQASLQDYLNDLRGLLAQMHSVTGSSGPWPVLNGPTSIIEVHRRLTDSTGSSRPALDRLLDESRINERRDAYENLLNRLVILGAVRRSGTPGEFVYEPVRTRVRALTTLARRKPIKITQNEVGWFLGYRTKAVSNELRRAAEYGGYDRDPVSFVNRLLGGHVPRYLAIATGRYFVKYRSEVDNHTGEPIVTDCPDWVIIE